MSDNEPILFFDYPYFYKERIPFVPKIFEGAFAREGFDANLLRLDGQMGSSLDWQEEIEQARLLRSLGKLLVWEIDLGLFNRLPLPFSDTFQIKTLILSLHHFRENIWTEFADHTLGVILYRGAADFSLHFPWDEQMESFHQQTERGELSTSLFCRDRCAQYLNQLADHLPGYLTPILLLEGQRERCSLISSLHRDLWSRFAFFIDGPIPTLGLSWRSYASPYGYLGEEEGRSAEQQIDIGLCLPDSIKRDLLQRALHWIGSRPFRIVREDTLTAEWEELSRIVVFSADPLVRRKLLGFCAAGGEVISIGPPLSLPNEKNVC